MQLLDQFVPGLARDPAAHIFRDAWYLPAVTRRSLPEHGKLLSPATKLAATDIRSNVSFTAGVIIAAPMES